MAFTYNCVTFSGAALLAQASAANPIVYIGAVAGTSDYIDTELQQMSSVNDYRWDVSGGEIIASSATSITARIIAGFHNRASEVTIKTIGIVARLASQTDAEAVVLAAVSDPNASIRIPPTTEPPVTIEVALNITISDALSVTVTSSTAGSAMLSDLDRLVSCHKAGQPYLGEAQTIYGSKRFMSDIHAPDIHLNFIETDEDAIVWTGYDAAIRILQDAQHDEALKLDAPIVIVRDALEVGGQFTCGSIASDLIPEGGGNDIGGSSARWSSVYAENIDANHYTGGQVDGDVEVFDTLISYGMVDLRGGYSLDNAGALTMSKYPLVPGTATIQIGGIFLAVVVSTLGGGVNVNSGATIPSTLTIYKAESVPQATGSLLTPKFGSGQQLTNNGSNYVAINAFSIANSGQQVLVFCVRVQ